MNLALRRFEENMVNLINSAQLPTEAKRLVVHEILTKLEVQAEKEVLMELQAMQEGKEKEANELHTDNMEERNNTN